MPTTRRASFNAREWVRIVRRSGAKYITVTARYFRFVATHALPVDDRLAVAEVDVF